MNAITRSSDRGSDTATSVSGLAPTAINRRARAFTRPPSAEGDHEVSSPSAARTAAKRLRAAEPTAVKSPPRYTLSAVGTMARTVAETFGRNERLSAPVTGSRAATRHTALPLTAVNSPPT